MAQSAAFTFRSLEAADVEWFNAVRNAAAPMLHDPRTFTVAETVAWLPTNSERYQVMVHRDHGEVGYFRTASCPVGAVGCIQIGADVAPAFQGQGLGFLAYTQFMSDAVEAGTANQFCLEVRASNARAIRLYHRLGFREVAVSRIGAIGDDSITMVWCRVSGEALAAP